jgi:hypothetical protein
MTYVQRLSGVIQLCVLVWITTRHVGRGVVQLRQLRLPSGVTSNAFVEVLVVVTCACAGLPISVYVLLAVTIQAYDLCSLCSCE